MARNLENLLIFSLSFCIFFYILIILCLTFIASPKIANPTVKCTNGIRVSTDCICHTGYKKTNGVCVKDSPILEMIGKSYDKIYYVQQYSNGANITLLQSDALISNYRSSINFDRKERVLYWMDQKSNLVSLHILANSCLIYVNNRDTFLGKCTKLAQHQ